MLGSCGWQRSRLLPCPIKPGVHFFRSTLMFWGRGKLKQHVVSKKVWACWCQSPICTRMWKCEVVWWGRWFGRARSIPQERRFLRVSSERSYGSCMRLTSFRNCCRWTIMLVPIWTRRTLRSYLKGISRLRGVSLLIHSDMSLSHQKIVGWLQMTSTSASHLLLAYLLSWNHGKATNLLFLLHRRTMSANFLLMLQWGLRNLSQSITVNNFSTILDVQLGSPTAFLPRITSLWISPVGPFFFQIYKCCLSIHILRSWLRLTELMASLSATFSKSCISSSILLLTDGLAVNIHRYLHCWLLLHILKLDADACSILRRVVNS